jgi:hypothetical protein
MKNSSVTIGNRTRNLPACSTVPQPTAPPRARNTVRRHYQNELIVSRMEYFGAYFCIWLSTFRYNVSVSISVAKKSMNMRHDMLSPKRR